MEVSAWFSTHRKCWKLSDNRWKCKRCKKIGRYHKPKTWVAKLRKSRKYLRKLVRYFVLGVPAYRLRFESPVNLKATEYCFRIIRQAIYQESLKELSSLKGKLEIDETTFGGRRKGKRGWGVAGKVIVFAIYQRNGRVITFPISSPETDTIYPLIEQHTKPLETSITLMIGIPTPHYLFEASM